MISVELLGSGLRNVAVGGPAEVMLAADMMSGRIGGPLVCSGGRVRLRS